MTFSPDQQNVDIIVDISRRMTTVLNLGLGLPEMVAEIAESTCTRFHLHSVAIYLYNTAREILDLQTVFVHDGEEDSVKPLPQYHINDDGPVARAARTGTTVLADGQPGLIPPLAVPMTVMGELIGVLCLIPKQDVAYDEKVLRCLDTLSEQSATAIDNIRLFDTGRVAQHESTLLYRISRSINETSQATQILDAIIKETGPLDFDVHLYVFENYDLTTSSYFRTIAKIPAGATQAVIENTQYPIRNLDRDENGLFVCENVVNELQTEHQTYFHDRGIQAVMNSRMNLGGHTMGSISFTSPEPRTFSVVERRLIRGLSDLAASAVERSRLYEEQVLITERLQTLDNVKSQFLANMSHELRTPLNAILNFTDFMIMGIMGPITDEQRNCLEMVLESATHLLALINDVLDMTKIEAGMLTLFLEESVNMREELDHVIATGEVLVKDADVKFIKDIDESLPRITCDRRRIRQVFLNLISNAAKFTEHGSITLRVVPNGGDLLCSVIDTGPGIAREDQEVIFEPFKQTVEGLKQASGTGLGLAISKRMIESHHGKLWLESDRGKGAAFYFTLPINNS